MKPLIRPGLVPPMLDGLLVLGLLSGGLICGGLLGASTLAHAQEDRAAGLFVEARQLPLVSQSMELHVLGDEAELRVSQTFYNNGEGAGQADWRAPLPAGAELVGFAFWTGERVMSAELQEAGAAEAAHHAAASEGRATGLAREKDGLQHFSVFPVPAGQARIVETRLRIPVETTMGRRRLRLPLGAFLGQQALSTPVLAEIRSERPIEEVGVVGLRPRTLERKETATRLLFSADEEVELWWTEAASELELSAARFEIGEGRTGVEVSALVGTRAVGDVGAKPVRVILDDSASMRRRLPAIVDTLRRVQLASPGGVSLTLASGEGLPGDALGEGLHLTLSKRLGVNHRVTGEQVAKLALAQCGPDARCLVITDAQLPGLENLGQLSGVVLALADADERAWRKSKLPSAVRLVASESQSRPTLLRMVDEAVLPVLAVQTSEGNFVEREELRVPAGSMARRYLAEEATNRTGKNSVRLVGTLDGANFDRELPVVDLPAGSPEALRARRGYWRAYLVNAMRDWKAAPNEALKAEIVRISLAEQIPTAFTSLQVDDPELSLSALQPGDPILTVHGEPGLVEVFAWYPMGELRRLRKEEDGMTFSDRFLVPRSQPDRPSRVEILKRFADGTRKREVAWYVVDSKAPAVEVRETAGALALRALTDAEDISVVSLAVDGIVYRLVETEPGHWPIEVPERELSLDGTVHLSVRDRAGNLTHLKLVREGGVLSVERDDVSSRMESVAQIPDTRYGGDLVGPAGTLAWRNGLAHLAHEGRTFQFTVSEATRSLRPTALWVNPAGGAVLGTESGEVWAIPAEPGAARLLARVGGGLPITGLAPHGGGYLASVLGGGLWRLAANGKPSELSLGLGSRYLTGLVPTRGTPLGNGWLVGSGYGGLFFVPADLGRARRVGLDEPLITGLGTQDGRIVVHSAELSWTLGARGEWIPTAAHTTPENVPDNTARDVVAGASLEGQLWLGRLEGGLEWGGEAGLPLNLGLSVAESRINDVVAWEGLLWVASEGGLWAVVDPAGNAQVHRVLSSSVHDLDVGPGGLLVAGAQGIHRVDPSGGVLRLDDPLLALGGRFSAVSWAPSGDGAEWYAGSLDGLFRKTKAGLEPVRDAAGGAIPWVSALTVWQDHLMVGTYSQGLYRLAPGEGGPAAVTSRSWAPVPGGEHQWVPLGGLSVVDGCLWMGGVGEAPRVACDGAPARAVGIPMRDTHRVVEGEDGPVFLGSEGVFQAERVHLSARTTW